MTWRYATTAFLFILLIVILLVAAITRTQKSHLNDHPILKPQDTKATSTPAPTPSPAIPASSDAAKAYIERAAAAANKNDYRQAATILEEGVKQFPSDQNLELTKEYYENQAIRYGQ